MNNTEGNILNATNARGMFLTGRRQNKVASSSRSINNERNFGDSGYEMTKRHEDRTKIENGTEKELHMLKQQLKEEQELHR